jgi:hypothetical protein
VCYNMAGLKGWAQGQLRNNTGAIFESKYNLVRRPCCTEQTGEDVRTRRTVACATWSLS